VTVQQFVFAGFVLTADQVTKACVASCLRAGQSVPIGSRVRIRCVVKRFHGHGLMNNRIVLLLLWGAALGAVFLATSSGYVFQRPAAQIGLAAAVAGAASNLYDRLRHGAVIDFVDLGGWPIFNLADVAITLGVMAAIWFI
jgi:signal peptidase II